MPKEIRYIPHPAIDKEAWDQCIDRAGNGRIYAFSGYLDQLSPGWDALVMGDYETVMPLTWKKKYGIRYLYQPFLTAQLGVMGKEAFSLTEAFINAIPEIFRLAEVPLNSGNSNHWNGTLLPLRKNYILPLEQSYENIQLGYQENTRRNCRKAIQESCVVEKGFDADQVVALALGQMKQYDARSAVYTDRFRRLYPLLLEKKMATTYGIRKNGLLLASCCFFFSHHRAYYILVGNHPQSRTIGASHALIDAFIRDHAGSGIILDFEGSDIPGLAAFYSGFGAVNEPYPFLRFNRLPFFLRWLKK